ncbi:MAG: hypothetical protein II504_04630 [Clostridia bacterium]|nr:hypothetical protein [Clostridia bacterium]
MFLLKLPFRAAAIPLLIALLAVRVASALITGLSSIVTNTICTLSFAVAAGIWMFGVGTSQDAMHVITIGLIFLLIPRVADWLVEEATDLGTTLVAFLLG